MSDTQVLQQGVRGDLVKQWQLFLIEKKYLAPGNATGYFGPLTHTATRSYQRAVHLVDDGVVGRATWAAAKADAFPIPSNYAGVGNRTSDWPPPPTFGPLPMRPHDIRFALFGRFNFTVGTPPNIVIDSDWVRRNIVPVAIPQLRRVPSARFLPAPGLMNFHVKAAAQLKALWQAWENHGLLDRITGFEGSFTPRFVAGTNVLSNHAFGIAFDINTRENKFGAQPARVGQSGSVRELIPLANEHGFYWGGHFPQGRLDGMHFEVARLL